MDAEDVRLAATPRFDQWIPDEVDCYPLFVISLPPEVPTKTTGPMMRNSAFENERATRGARRLKELKNSEHATNLFRLNNNIVLTRPPMRGRYGRRMIEWPTITAAVSGALAGDKDAGRSDLLACWEATAEADHAKRCVIAHYLADLQPSLTDEVSWDERALAAHPHVVDDDLAPLGITSARGLAPSLHLNLGDGYLRQGRIADAQAQLDAGLAAVVALGDDGYATMVRNGLGALKGRVEAARTVEGEAAVRPR